MILPGAERAVVESQKVRDYLLSASHPVGRFKAAFFVSLGYSSGGWEVLAGDIRRHALEHQAVATDANRHGQKYEVRGTLVRPAGRTAVVVTVWIVLRGEDLPRFVTAFPGPRP